MKPIGWVLLIGGGLAVAIVVYFAFVRSDARTSPEASLGAGEAPRPEGNIQIPAGSGATVVGVTPIPPRDATSTELLGVAGFGSVV